MARKSGSPVQGLISWTKTPEQPAASAVETVLDAVAKGSAEGIDAALADAAKLGEDHGAEVFERAGAGLIDMLDAPRPKEESTTIAHQPGHEEAEPLIPENALKLFKPDGALARSDKQLGRLMASVALGSVVRPQVNMFGGRCEAAMRLFQMPDNATERDRVHLKNAWNEAAEVLSEMAPDAPWTAWPVHYARADGAELNNYERLNLARRLNSAGEHFRACKNFAQAEAIYRRGLVAMKSVHMYTDAAEVAISLLANLGRSCFARGDAAAASGKFKSAIEKAEYRGGLGGAPLLRPDCLLVLDVKHDLAQVYISRGKYDYANTILKGVIELAEKSNVENAKGELAALDYQLTLARLYDRQGKDP